jgi:hypothetical protein
MKLKFTIILMVLTTFGFAGNYREASGAFLSLSYSNAMWLPIISVSQYLIRPIGYHEINIEYMEAERNDNITKSKNFWFGINYSLLFKLPIRFLYVGPTIGFVENDYGKDSKEFFQVAPNVYSNHLSINSTYLGGIKESLIFGDKLIRLKIDNRTIAGVRYDWDKSKLAIIDDVRIGFLIAF